MENDAFPEFPEAAAREAEEHRYDNVDPYEQMDEFFRSIGEAQSYLEQATTEMMQADGAARGLPGFQASLQPLRIKLSAAIDALKQIKPDLYMERVLKEYADDQSRREDQADAQSL